MATPPICGLLFVGQSYPITDNNLTRVDETHWVLDVCTTVRPDYWELREVVLFLTAPGVIAPNLAVGLYVKTGVSEWLYRGCVHAGHPCEVMPLQWPVTEANVAAAPGPGAVQIGLSVELGSDVIHKEGSKLGAREDFAKRVAGDLFRFLESFHSNAQRIGDNIMVPANALDRWFTRFTEKFRRDPDFLTRRGENF